LPPKKTTTPRKRTAGVSPAKRAPRKKVVEELPPPPPVSDDAAWRTAVLAAESKKAEGIRVLDLRPVTSFTDFLLICSGSNTRQIQAIADEIQLQLKQIDERPKSVEGYQNAEWILMDYGDYVVNIFSEKARGFYDLERLWRDAKEVSDVTAVTAS
jgi:ribosome-associated protein